MCTTAIAKAVLAFIAIVLLACCSTAPTKTELRSAEQAPGRSGALERYKKNLEDQLGPIWYRLAAANQDQLSLGTVKATFQIPAAGGKPQNVRVTSRLDNGVDQLIARHAIEQLRLPPIPAVVLAEIHNDHLKLEEWFTVLPEP